jgi:hypothetical protein
VCELRWLRDERVVEARQFGTYKEASGTWTSSPSFTVRNFGATNAEVSADEALRYSREL